MAQTLSAAALLSAWEAGVSETSVQRALILLSTAWPERSAADWAEVSIGRRDEQLLRLRQEWFGTRLETVAECPQCGASLDIAFQTTDIVANSSPSDQKKLAISFKEYELSFRLPVSTDLIAIGRSSNLDTRQVLLERCIGRASYRGNDVALTTVPEDVVSVVIEAMSAADPHADVKISVTCATCNHVWPITFDILSHLWEEIDEWAQSIFHEIHILASAYGWSEQEILEMSAVRREAYLSLIDGGFSDGAIA